MPRAAEAIKTGQGSDIQFPVTGVELEFHVGVTRSQSIKLAILFVVLLIDVIGIGIRNFFLKFMD